MQELRVIVPWREARDVRRVAEAFRCARRLGFSPRLDGRTHYPGAAGIVLPWEHVRDLYRAFGVLLACNRSWLRAHPGEPSLYQLGVRWKREPRGQEDWVTMPLLREMGWGDCDDIAGARVAELRHAGERALPYFKPTKLGYHVQVRRAGGRIEDPSAVLGMKGRA